MVRDELARREEPTGFGACPRCGGEMDGPYFSCATCAVKSAVADYHQELRKVSERFWRSVAE